MSVVCCQPGGTGAGDDPMTSALAMPASGGSALDTSARRAAIHAGRGADLRRDAVRDGVPDGREDGRSLAVLPRARREVEARASVADGGDDALPLEAEEVVHGRVARDAGRARDVREGR